jgi:hypothetical protein
MFDLRQVASPWYLTYEGSVRVPGEPEPIACFLLLGQDHFTVELKSLSRIVPDGVMQTWVSHLGSPAYGPITHSRTGEIEEPFGEMILTATWRFPREEREFLRARVDRLLQKGLDSERDSVL